MSWIFLIMGGLFEVTFTGCLGKAKEASGSAAYLWYGGFAVAIILSMACLIKATKTLPIGTSYAVWTGIGAVGAVLLGIILYHESANFWRLLFLTTLIISIIGLKIVSH